MWYPLISTALLLTSLCPQNGRKHVHVFPFGMMTEVRDASRSVDMQVQIYNGTRNDIEPHSLTIFADGRPVMKDLLKGRIPGDGGTLFELYGRMDELGHDHHGHDHHGHDHHGHQHHDPRSSAHIAIRDSIANLRSRGKIPYRNISFRLPLDKVFAKTSVPGTTQNLRIVVNWKQGGRSLSTEIGHTIEILPAFRRFPILLPGPQDNSALRFVSCDLHVHHCRDEALSGCPNCPAEMNNIRASFSLAQLKSQYQALGIDGFAATSHSYCINSAAEYASVQKEAAQLSDKAFVVLPDTELVNVEVGSQEGKDLSDLWCATFGAGPTNHGGAHGIKSRKIGGSDGLLQNCDITCNTITQNILAINKEGGFLTINHPTSNVWGWNSFEATKGLEAGSAGATAVEIWNGPLVTGQGDSVGWWVRQMLAGKILYAQSGSDVHDAAYHHGLNHALISGPLTQEVLVRALKSGHSYISNGDFLALAVSIGNGALVRIMGDITPFPRSLPPNVPVQLVLLYSFAKPSKVTVFRGRVGDKGETALKSYSNLIGAGFVTLTTPLENTRSSHYRAYGEADDRSLACYTNPLFFRRL